MNLGPGPHAPEVRILTTASLFWERGKKCLTYPTVINLKHYAAPQSKNAVCAIQITYKLLSFIL